jgi:hypothetical protein
MVVAVVMMSSDGCDAGSDDAPCVCVCVCVCVCLCVCVCMCVCVAAACGDGVWWWWRQWSELFWGVAHVTGKPNHGREKDSRVGDVCVQVIQKRHEPCVENLQGSACS